MLQTPNNVQIPVKGESAVLQGLFTADEALAISFDLESDAQYLAFQYLSDEVSIRHARQEFQNASLFGLELCTYRIRSLLPPGFSRVFVNWVPRPTLLPGRSPRRGIAFEVVPGAIDYVVGGDVDNNGVQHGGTLCPASLGDTLCVNNLTRVKKRPVVSANGGLGRRFTLSFS